MRPHRSAQHPVIELPPARFFSRFIVAFGALALLWMPWVLLKQVDAFLGFLGPAELGRDVALAVLLLALPAAMLALLAGLMSGLARRLGLSEAGVTRMAWTLTVLPVACLCLWQFGSTGLAWWRLTVAPGLTVTANTRLAAMAVLLIALVVLWRTGALGRGMVRLVPLLMGLRGPAVLSLLASTAWLAWYPPRVMGWGPKGPAAVATPAMPAMPAMPDVYLITIDTLAAEDAAVCGSGPTLMPRLRAFASRAGCFDRHYATSNFTTPSTSTMETGALPWTHWGVQIVAKMAPAMRGQTLASLLRAKGYEAHSISANLLASPRHHGSFDEYDSQSISPSPSLGLKPRVALSVFPDTTLPFWLSALVPLLDTLDVHLFPEQTPFAPEHTYEAARPLLAKSGRPQFLWLHTLPPHDPFLPPPSTKHKLLPAGELDRWSQMLGMTGYAPEQQGLIDKHRLRYREAMMGADESLGRFLDELDRQGKLDGALVIITSDHGESFEKGYMGHAGHWLHEPVIRVPLVVKLPGQRTGQVVNTPVSLADVVPTVTDVLGLPDAPAAEGRSLKPALLEQSLAEQPVFAMAMERQSRFKPIQAGHYAVIDGRYKLVLDLAADRAELFDLSADPRELRDLSAAAPEVAARLRAVLDRRLAAAEQRRAAQFGNR